MSNVQNDIHEVEVTLEQAKNIQALGDTIARLEKNKDFREVITNGYFRDEASRLTLLSADPALSDKDRENVFACLRSIGELHSYLNIKKMKAELIGKDITDAEEALSELRAEDADSEE